MHPSLQSLMRQNYRPSSLRAPAWLQRLWRWL